MNTSFGALTDASQSLGAQRYALDVTGQNVANASTPGYVRQRADLAEVGTVVGVPTLYATSRTGSGVTVNGVTRMNDPVLDARSRAEHGRNESLVSQTDSLRSVEDLFNEPTDNGLSEQLNSFWNSWAGVANNPGSLAARNVVLQQASGLASTLNTMSAVLGQVSQTATDQLTQAVTDMNTASQSLASVNRSIAISAAAGTPSNSLFDQRDSLLMQLSNLGGAQATIQPDGTANVTLGGAALVAGVISNPVTLTGTQVNVNGLPATPTGGSAGGLVTSLTAMVPNYQARLDNVANALATTVNNAQAAGYDLAGAGGTPIFSGTTGATIKAVLANPSGVAASGMPGGNLDASNALAVSDFGQLTNGADDTYHQMISTLASESQQTSQSAQTQAAVTQSVDAISESSNGVSLDEETSNLLTFQRAYQASARVLTTVDEMLDNLINRTGRVGL